MLFAFKKPTISEHYRILFHKNLRFEKLEITQSNHFIFNFEKCKIRKTNWCIKDHVSTYLVAGPRLEPPFPDSKSSFYYFMINSFCFRLLPQK